MYYGFDIGGTKIAFAVYDGALNLCHEERMSTPGNDYEGLQQLIRSRVEQADAVDAEKAARIEREMEKLRRRRERREERRRQPVAAGDAQPVVAPPPPPPPRCAGMWCTPTPAWRRP